MKTLFLSLVLFAGCASPESISCDVNADRRHGRGVIISPTCALTVDHVYWDTDFVTINGKWRAKVRQRSKHAAEPGSTETGFDGLVLVQIEDGQPPFPADRVAVMAPTNALAERAVYYVSQRGLCRWPFGIMPGDSGSPILDANGRVVGLVRAVRGEWEGVTKVEELSRLNSEAGGPGY
jgi:hypothetical protein